ncbi:hypothetical protein EVAR_70212_1 [Eumeta japonica]|uniref:Uncharacterized protein n=1 Tax=Eumeta variegata TaxID=151549 RepID=A0A4C1T8M0_EUMVA|nr:hypothetical protein EVAR_70212_1 [Eumeta japonica]
MRVLISGLQFSYADLRAEFVKAMPDFDAELNADTKNYGIGFAITIAYTIGPESRSVKENSNDKVWKLRYMTDQLIPRCIFVATYKSTKLTEPQPKFTEGKISLTIKQASLLALDLIARCVDVCYLDGSIIMTPLAGAVYSKNDLEEMLEELNAKLNINLTMPILIKRVPQSCQNGGHYLPYSDGSCAVASAVCYTKHKDAALRRSIINKTYKQYTAHGKVLKWKPLRYTQNMQQAKNKLFLQWLDKRNKFRLKLLVLHVQRWSQQPNYRCYFKTCKRYGTDPPGRHNTTKGSSTVTPFVAVGQSLSGTYIHM